MRNELKRIEGSLVSVRGRVAGYKDHPNRRDLKTVLLRSVSVRTLEKEEGDPIELDHLWFLVRHIRDVGINPRINSKIFFIGSVYSYSRLSRTSATSGKHGTIDYAILPIIKGRNAKPRKGQS